MRDAVQPFLPLPRRAKAVAQAAQKLSAVTFTAIRHAVPIVDVPRQSIGELTCEGESRLLELLRSGRASNGLTGRPWLTCVADSTSPMDAGTEPALAID